jgi:hypothetical protein
MKEISLNEFTGKPLRVHEFLAGVPIKTLLRVELPGGREDMTLPEINSIAAFSEEGKMEVGPVTKALFHLRDLIGRIFGWDDDRKLAESVTYLDRLTDEDRARSLAPPGQMRGITRVLYFFENEFLGEIVNRTVHCFWAMASERTSRGYDLYLAVYVKKLNWFTPIYMALISPFLKLVIYPSMVKSVECRWAQRFPADPAGRG